MKSIALFVLAFAFVASQAHSQNLTSIALGSPSCAIIDGKIVEVGDRVKGKTEDLKVKEILDGEVVVVDSKGTTQTLRPGQAPESSGQTGGRFLTRPELTKEEQDGYIKELKDGELTKSELFLLIISRKKDEIVKLIRRPDRATENIDGETVWLYYDFTYDDVSHRMDSITSVTFKGDIAVKVERQ